MVDIEVGGSVNHRQTGAKSELGVGADHLVIYYDPDDMEKAMRTIERTTRLHQYAKELKAGLIPKRIRDGDPSLETEAPPRGGAT
jgi:hypothetical protein